MPKQIIKQNAAASGRFEPIQSTDRLFINKPQRTTAGQLLLEMALFAAENKQFQESRDNAAARRAQIHLQRIIQLSEQRQAEIASLMLNHSRITAMLDKEQQSSSQG
jgi:hypothetical protein